MISMIWIAPRNNA